MLLLSWPVLDLLGAAAPARSPALFQTAKPSLHGSGVAQQAARMVSREKVEGLMLNLNVFDII